jgi:FkbM family methyltransferase
MNIQRKTIADVDHLLVSSPKETVADSLIRMLLQPYATLVKWGITLFGVCPPGLGMLARQIKRPFVFQVDQLQFYFHPPAGSMYAWLLTRGLVERETHLLLSRLFADETTRFRFVDVGAAIGELVLRAGRFDNVIELHAFDPDPNNVDALLLSGRVNGLRRLTVYPHLVGRALGEQYAFIANEGTGTSGKIETDDVKSAPRVSAIALDAVLSQHTGQDVWLVDVEGAEVEVLTGAKSLVAAQKPLIVFEFNELSRSRYSLNDVMSCLGQDYAIYRLRNDGLFDCHTQSETWNCVAVPQSGYFAKRLAEFLINTKE